jgi:hypothetical protein
MSNDILGGHQASVSEAMVADLRLSVVLRWPWAMGLGFSDLIFEFCGAVAIGYDLGLFFI